MLYILGDGNILKTNIYININGLLRNMCLNYFR